MEWISVKDRLPSDIIPVVIVYSYEEVYPLYIIGTYNPWSEKYKLENWRYFDFCPSIATPFDTHVENYGTKIIVTHWMPLPDAPL